MGSTTDESRRGQLRKENKDRKQISTTRLAPICEGNREIIIIIIYAPTSFTSEHGLSSLMSSTCTSGAPCHITTNMPENVIVLVIFLYL